jgi:hypothetical protein
VKFVIFFYYLKFFKFKILFNNYKFFKNYKISCDIPHKLTPHKRRKISKKHCDCNLCWVLLHLCQLLGVLCMFTSFTTPTHHALPIAFWCSALFFFILYIFSYIKHCRRFNTTKNTSAMDVWWKLWVNSLSM